MKHDRAIGAVVSYGSLHRMYYRPYSIAPNATVRLTAHHKMYVRKMSLSWCTKPYTIKGILRMPNAIHESTETPAALCRKYIWYICGSAIAGPITPATIATRSNIRIPAFLLGNGSVLRAPRLRRCKWCKTLFMQNQSYHAGQKQVRHVMLTPESQLAYSHDVVL